MEADLADRGIDLEAPGLLEARSWGWLRVRILGLFATPPVAWVRVTGRDRYRMVPTWGTRSQNTLTPPTFTV